MTNIKIEKNLLEGIIKIFPGIIIIINGESKILGWNKNLETIIQYTSDELETMFFADLLTFDERKKIPNRIQTCLNGGNINFESKIITKDKKKIPFYFSATSAIINNNEYIIANGLDITELKRTEKNAEKYLNLAGVIIVALNRDGIIFLMNRKGYEVLEYEGDELLGKNWFETCIPSYLKVQVFDVFKSLMGGEIEPVEFYENPVVTKNNVVKIIAWHNTLLYDDEGDIIGTLSAGEDVTKLERMRKELLERISHELKTPLVVIKGYSELLTTHYKDQLNSDIFSLIERITYSSSRLEAIINNILKASKLELGVMTIDKTEHNLSTLLRDIVEEMQKIAEMRGHTIELKIDDDLIAHFDEHRIRNVINDLLLNAIKYTPPNGKIMIKSDISDDGILISIDDNGIGFTEEEKSLIFKRFGKIERYDKGWEVNIEGTGLGLYISKKIIELHGGKIWVVSEGRDKGSTFNFTLPY